MAASAARLDAAGVLRRLGHAIVAHEAGDEVLNRISVEAEELLRAVEATPDRIRTPLDMVHAVFVVPPPDGRGRTNFPDDIVTGKANPLGMAADITREGDVAVLRTTLGPAFEGAPGRAHGGTVAALIDEVMGFVLSIHATPAYTGRLTITYRAPTPLGVEIEMPRQAACAPRPQAPDRGRRPPRHRPPRTRRGPLHHGRPRGLRGRLSRAGAHGPCRSTSPASRW